MSPASPAETSRPPQEPAAEAFRLDVIDERALAVDLDDRDQFAIAGLQVVVACDVDLAQLEVELLAQLGELRPRALAQMAPLRAVQNDLRPVYGYSPRVIVASETRSTARP